MKLKISATHEGKCNLCRKESVVFSVGDEESKRVVTICKDCSQRLGGMKLEEAVDKYGRVRKKAFGQGVKVYGKSVAG